MNKISAIEAIIQKNISSANIIILSEKLSIFAIFFLILFVFCLGIFIYSYNLPCGIRYGKRDIRIMRKASYTIPKNIPKKIAIKKEEYFP
jgi:hypothetical protein